MLPQRRSLREATRSASSGALSPYAMLVSSKGVGILGGEEVGAEGPAARVEWQLQFSLLWCRCHCQNPRNEAISYLRPLSTCLSIIVESLPACILEDAGDVTSGRSVEQAFRTAR